MKKTLLTCFLLASAALAGAQGRVSETEFVFDAAEDTTQVTTITDIINVQERVTIQNFSAAHYDKVWGRKTYLKLSYMVNAELKPKDDIDLGYDAINHGKCPDFKADWGAALQIGHSYNLHKKPIANILRFNLDYTFFDLSVAHYKKYQDGKLYDASSTWPPSGSTDKYAYMPWCLSKWEGNFGMNLGPSITVAPFTHLNVSGLHFLRLHAYYHIGYQAGLLYMPNDKKADASEGSDTPSGSNPSDYIKAVLSDVKLSWTHGLTQSFGVNLQWKAIGVGFEKTMDNRSYKAIAAETFGHDSYKFKGSSSRVYIEFCY